MQHPLLQRTLMRTGSLLFALGWLVPAQANDLLGISWVGSAYAVDSQTGFGSGLGAVGFSSLNCMAKGADTYYALSGDVLITIDPLTGEGTQIGTVIGLQSLSPRGMAYESGSGDLLVAVDGGASGMDALWRISVPTLQATLVGALDVPGITGLTMDPMDRLYGYDAGPPLANGWGLVRIDPSSGWTIDVSASDSGTNDIQFLTFLPTGVLLGGRSQLYQLDTATGARTPVGSPNAPFDLRGAEYRGPVIDPPGTCLGTTYCPAIPNSSGLAATLCMGDSISVASNQTRMFATEVASGQFGIFLAGTASDFVAQPGGSQGNLCLGGQLVRFTDSLQNSGPDGILDWTPNLFDFPANPSVAVAPGETWYFQAWFRDANPQPTSNFSDAVEVTFLF